MLDLQIRWLIRRDMPEVLEIERASFANYWLDQDFLSALKTRNVIGNVAEHVGKVVGFNIYELHPGRLAILNFAVAPEFRRQGVGSQMISRMVDKLSQQRRTEIVLSIRERNLGMQQFLRSNGFQCVDIAREAYDDSDEDAYEFRYFLSKCEAAS